MMRLHHVLVFTSMISKLRQRFHSLKNKKSVSGSFWVIFGFGVQKSFQLLSNLVLTRILYPEAFGLMAIVYAFMAGVQMFSDIGIRPSVIQSQDTDDPRFLNTAWTLQIIRGFCVAAVVCLIAYPASVFYKEPLLLGLLCAVASTAIIMGFQSINIILAERDINYKKLMIMRAFGQLTSLIVTAVLAYFYQSVWALAIGAVFGCVLDVVMGHKVFRGHKHSFLLDSKYVRKLFRFGQWIFWSTVFTYFTGQGMRAIEGAMVSTESLAMIAISGTLAWIAGELVVRYLGAVVFPTLSRVHRDQPDQFPAMLSRIRSFAILTTVPLFGFLSVLANVVVAILYDDRYAMAGPILAVMALVGAMRTLPMFYQNALLSIGQSKENFFSTGVIAVANVILLVAGFKLAGLYGLLIAPGLAYLVGHVVTSIIVKKYGWVSIKADLLFFLLMAGFVAATYFVNFR